MRLNDGFRTYLGCWFGLCGAFAIATAAAAFAHGVVAGGFVALAVAALAASWGVCWVRIGVFGEEDALVVRGILHTQRIPVNRIRDFRLGGRNFESPGKAIRVVLDDGTTVVLWATGRYFAPLDEHERRLAALRRWRGIVGG